MAEKILLIIAAILIDVIFYIIAAQAVVWGLSIYHVSSGLAAPFLMLCALGTVIRTSTTRQNQ